MRLIVAVIHVSLIGYYSVVFAKPEDEIYDVSDDITLRDIVFELKSLVFDQNEKIMALERQNEIQSKELAELRTMVRTQDEKVLHLQRQCACKTKVENTSKLIEPTPINVQSKKASTFKRPGISGKVIQTTAQQRIARAADTPIAFYAYSSHTFTRPNNHFILSFETVITNTGHGYHHHSGIFIAPRSGYYVFTWSNEAYISTELMLNGAPQSSVYFDARDGVGGNTAGTVIVHLDFDDEVSVRINGDNNNYGNILSDSRGRTYFGGWLFA